MQNKKIIIGAVVVLVSVGHTTALSSEIAGTRVQGQGAVCAEGQGKALEINATTKQQWSYCIELPPPPIQKVTPTPTPTPTAIAVPKTVEPTPVVSAGSVVEPVIETVVISTGSTLSSVTETSTVTATPTPTPSAPVRPETPERSNVYIADVTAKTTTVRSETDQEWEQRVEFMWLHWYEEILKWLSQILNFGWLR